MSFQDYTNVLIKTVNFCIKQPHSYKAVLTINRDGSAKLDFI